MFMSRSAKMNALPIFIHILNEREYLISLTHSALDNTVKSIIMSAIYELIKVELDEHNQPQNEVRVDFFATLENIYDYFTKDGTSDVNISVLNHDGDNSRDYIIYWMGRQDVIIKVHNPADSNPLVGRSVEEHDDYYYCRLQLVREYGFFSDPMIPKITTLDELADYINNYCEREHDYPVFEVTEIIERNGWVDEQGDNEFDICHSDDERLTINENDGQAEVVPYEED